MRKSDYQLIAFIATILGAVFLLAGLYAGTYYELHIGFAGQGSWYAYLYAQYAPSLLICGIVSLIISALMWRASKATPTPAPAGML
jgi:hypothetical protein